MMLLRDKSAYWYLCAMSGYDKSVVAKIDIHSHPRYLMQFLGKKCHVKDGLFFEVKL